MDIWSHGNPTKLNFYVELTSAQINKKIKALRLYKSQMRVAGNPRSVEVIKSLAIFRGSAIGSHFAEAFYNHKTQL